MIGRRVLWNKTLDGKEREKQEWTTNETSEGKKMKKGYFALPVRRLDCFLLFLFPFPDFFGFIYIFF